MTHQMPPQQRPRLAFRSKSPNLSGTGEEVPTQRRGWGSVTRHQMSGWRFQIRRLSNGVALQDTSMLVDPLRRQSRALTVSALLGCVGLVIALILSVFKPAGIQGANTILAERSSGAMYVAVNDVLHPVLNLASARLIIGKPDNPTSVKSGEIDKHPLGNELGIPGAPDRIVPSSQRDSRWMVCDAETGEAAGVTVIAGEPEPGGGRAGEMAAGTAVLASSDGGKVVWLIWDNQRARIDLEDAAVASAVGINLNTPLPRPINRHLLNLIPETAPLRVPFVPNAGDPVRFVWPGEGEAPVSGSVVTDIEAEQRRYYVVTPDGLQSITPVIAAILRADNAYGLIEPPQLTPDQVRKAPMVKPIAVDHYPSEPLTVVDPVTDPVVCARWTKMQGAPTSSLALMVGQSLPVNPQTRPVALTGAGPTTASRVMMPLGQGFFVQATGQDPQSQTRESLFWVSDLGVRFGIEDSEGENAGKAAEALGVVGQQDGPLPIPWSVLVLFQPGPTLSKADALRAH